MQEIVALFLKKPIHQNIWNVFVFCILFSNPNKFNYIKFFEDQLIQAKHVFKYVPNFLD